MKSQVAREELSPVYPQIFVRLIGTTKSQFTILRHCELAMLKAGCSREQVSEFLTVAGAKEDMSYLLCTCMKYFNIH